MLLSLVFALIQRTEAKKLLEQIVELQQENDKLKMELQQTRLSSIIAQEEAMRQAELARKEFEAQTKNEK